MASKQASPSHWLEADLAGALALRRWMLEALTAQRDHVQSAPAEPPAQSPSTWKAFLEIEACALPLANNLPAGLRAGLPTDIKAVLDERSVQEASRVLAARGQLSAIGQAAAADGLRAVALKGAVALASGTELDLEDLDFLLTPEDAGRMAAVLTRAGYGTARGGSSRHLGTLFAPGGIGVDLHTTLSRSGDPVPDRLWSGVIPLEGIPGLERLSSAEHLWHVLIHNAVDHPDRRGRIRDLLLIAAACASCTGEDLDQIRERIAQHVVAVELGRLLSMAIAIHEGRPVEDGFRRNAASAYTLRRLLERLPIPTPLVTVTWRWSFALLGSRADRREMWTATRVSSLALSKYRFIAFVEGRAPRLGRAWRLALRLIRLPVVLLLAGALAGFVRLSVPHLERRARSS